MSKQQELQQSKESAFFTDILLENLFENSRFPVWPKYYKIILHIPVSMLLLFVRLIVGFVGFLILSLLPRTSLKRNAILKGLCKVFGLVVDVDAKHIDESAKVLVANHITPLDRLAVNAMVPCSNISGKFEVSSVNSLSFWNDVDVRFFRDLTDDEIWCLRTSIESSPIPLLHFPEAACTNGKIGLLKFHPGIFSVNAAVQPVLIQASLSSFVTVSTNVCGSAAWADAFWSLILPSTNYKLRTLPAMVKLPSESAEDFSKRVQTTMASAMNLASTNYTSSDKLDLFKHFQSPVPNASSSSSSQSYQHLDNVQNSHTADSTPKNAQLTLPMSTAAKTFGKSPKERMASYHHRKALLLDAARQKYLENHR